MRRISSLTTVLITSFVMALSGLGASPIASASENETVRVSATFRLGTSVLTNAQKAAIKKAVATSGADATFLVTGVAGKLPGVSDKGAQLLAKKRGQVVKAYLVKLGVNKSSITIKVKITRLGIVPKSKIVGTYKAPVSTTPNTTPTTPNTTPTTTTAPTTPTTPTTPVALTCATGGICVVGDRGPGGGIVYYVSAANFTSTGSTCDTACKYLEVAPATWQSAGESFKYDVLYKWSTNTTDPTGQVLSAASPTESGFTDEQENWKIGKGFSNTSLMKATSAAQTKVLAYAGTDASARQWFIPSMNELNELCKYTRGQTTGDPTVACDDTGTLKTGIANDLGGFQSNFYWSSSEVNADSAWHQSFELGDEGEANDKDGSAYVRPIRAF